MVVFFGNLLILLLFTGLCQNANLHILMSFLIIISTPVGVVLLNESKESKASSLLWCSKNLANNLRSNYKSLPRINYSPQTETENNTFAHVRI